VSGRDSPQPTTATTTCCIAGGGPAGMMLGFLLARAGIDVTVLEKHGDFLRDFRGDTIHPSTLELMHELGLLDDFLKLPHTRAETLSGRIGRRSFTIADFRHLPTRCKFIALMPQWDFLDFLADRGRHYPGFHLNMNAEATGLLEEGGAIAGVRVKTERGAEEIRAALTVGTFATGHVLVEIDRGDYWQCAFVIPKGGFDMVRERGLQAFRDEIARLAPELAGRLDELDDWEKVKLLTVTVDRLAKWHRPGLLVIGDAAHAMSPIGGVGINLAIQDAVAAANRLAGPLHGGNVSDDDLASIQRRREFPTRMTQRLQVFVQNRVISRVLGSAGTIRPPFIVRLADALPVLRRIPARLVGIGFRPEHVRTAEAAPAA
jgi:2-polyprenyl-6-methoxyphenol hydroxylase-like FAD-dependent oxidoreductase